MSVAIVTGFVGADRERNGQIPSREGAGGRRHRQQPAQVFLRRGRVDRLEHASSSRPDARRTSRTIRIDIRDQDGVFKTLRRIREGHRAGRPHGGAAVPRLGGPRAAHRLHRQRQRHAGAARGDPAVLPRGRVHLHLDQQGLRRHAEPAAARRAGDALGGRPGASLRRARHRRDDVASTSRSTACSARARSRPTCWCRSTGATSA